jgi:plasmid stability protein
VVISISETAPMGSMVIRNIPDDVLTRLKEQAKLAGKSTEQLAREALAEKARPSREEIIRRMDEIRAMSKPIDLETTLRIMEEARAERDARPHIPGLDNDH